MLTVLRQRNFALFWAGQLISILGDMILFVALPFYIYDLTGSALATGAMFITETVPRLLLGSAAGVFVDRWDRKRTMVIADLLRAGLLCLLLLPVYSPAWLWLIYVVAFFQAAISQFFYPAKNAIMPHLAEEQNLMPANALNALSNGLATVIGPLLGAALLGSLHFTGVVLLDAVSYLISGIMIALISVQPPLQTDGLRSDSRASWATFWQELLAGLQLIGKNGLIAAIFIVAGLVTLAQGIVTVLLVIFVKEILAGGVAELGWIVTTQGLGGIIGAFVTGHVSRWVQPPRLVAFGAGGAGLLLLLMIRYPTLLVVLSGMTGAGVLIICWTISQEMLLQVGVASRYRGRVFGAFGTLNALLMLCGMGLASALGDSAGVLALLNVAGLLFVAAGGVAFVTLPRHMSHFLNNQTPAPDAEIIY